MKLLISIIISLSLLFIFCGCKKSEEEKYDTVKEIRNEQNMDTTSEVNADFPEQIQQKLTDKILVNAICVYPDSCKTGTGVKAVLGESLFWDRTDEIAAILLGDKEIESKYIKDYGDQKEQRYYTVGEEERLAISTAGYLDYKKMGQYMYISNVLYYDNRFDSYNGDVYSQKTDHSFMTQAEAWTKVQELMQELGVDISDEYTCYVMDYADMQREEEKVIAQALEEGGKVPEKKAQWTENDNCYCFKSRVVWNDYFVLPSWTGEGVDEDNITVILDQEGIVGLSIYDYYPLEFKEEFILQSPDEVVIKLQDFLQNIISDNFYEVQQISLCQKVIGMDAEKHIATIVPVWECKVLVKNAELDDSGYIQKIYFNAETLDQL